MFYFNVDIDLEKVLLLNEVANIHIFFE